MKHFLRSARILLGAIAPAWLRWHGTTLARREAAHRSRLDIFQAHFDALCAAVHHGVFLAEPGGSLTHVNERLRAMMGLAMDAPVTIDMLTDTVHEDERQRVRADWDRAIAEGVEYSSEHRVLNLRGGLRTVRVFAAPVVGPGGNCGYVGTVEDVTHVKTVEEQLLESQSRLQTIQDNLPALVSYLDRDEHYQSVNTAFERTYGRTRRDTIGLGLEDVMTRSDLEIVGPMMVRARAGETVCAERSLVSPDGRTLTLASTIVPHRAPDGDILGYCVMSIDVTARREAELALQHEKERAQVTLNSISDAVVRVDAQGRIEYMNVTAQRLTGWPLDDAMGKPVEAVLAMEVAGADRGPHPLRAALAPGFGVAPAPLVATLVPREGGSIPADLSVAAIYDREGAVQGAVAIFHDASAQRRLARRLDWQATHDSLTRLKNRRGLTQALETALAQPGSHTLLFLDLDRFKAVNDACGHAAGDELLCKVARRLERLVRSGDTICRIGGDEFVALLVDCSQEDASRAAEEMRAAVESLRFTREGREHRIGVSIGLARAQSGPGVTAEALLVAADGACYAAKSGGRNRVVAFTPRQAA